MSEQALLRAAWLSLTARWRRLLQHVRTHLALSIAVLLGAIGTSVLLISKAQSPAISEAPAWLAQNEFLVSLAAGLYALLFVVRYRAHLLSEHSQSWLIATPIPSRAFRRVAAVRVGLAISGQLLVIVGLLLVLSVANSLPIADLRMTMLSLTMGMVVGCLAGAVWRLNSKSGRSEDSRFIRRARSGSMTPSLDGLSRWPIAKAIAWHRPENSRMLFILAALSVPVGSSALLGLAILATWTLGSYLLALVRAVPSVAREAAVWLRPTTLPFASFAWSLARRALVHQLIGTVVLGAIVIGVGGRFASVVYLGALWLSLTALIGMIGIRQNYLSLPASGPTLLAVLLVTATESRARGWGLPVSVVLMMAQMRGVARGRS